MLRPVARRRRYDDGGGSTRGYGTSGGGSSPVPGNRFYYNPNVASSVHFSAFPNIAQLDDLSGNGLHLTPLGAGAPPALVTIAGRNYLTFTPGTGQVLRTAADVYLGQNVATVYAIVRNDDPAAGNRQYVGNNVALPTMYANGDWRIFQGSELFTTPIDTGVFHQNTGRFNADATSNLRQDGAVLGTGNCGAATDTGFALGGAIAAAVASWNGPIGAVVGYLGAQTTPQVASIEQWLRLNWGTP